MYSKEKYKLTEELNFDNCTLYRIQATKDFETIAGTVHKGDLGGWIESEFNLSQEDNCWVFDETKVYQMAQVNDNAIVAGEAIVKGYAKVFNDATVCEYTLLDDKANIGEYAKIYGNAVVLGKSDIKGCSEIYDFALVRGQNYITGTSKILGEIDGKDIKIEDSLISQESHVSGESIITNSQIIGKVEIANKSLIVNSHINSTCLNIAYINQEILNQRMILSDPSSLADTQTNLTDILQNALFKEI